MHDGWFRVQPRLRAELQARGTPQRWCMRTERSPVRQVLVLCILVAGG